MRRNQADRNPRREFDVQAARRRRTLRSVPAVDTLESRQLLSSDIAPDLLADVEIRPDLQFNRLSDQLQDLYREVRAANKASAPISVAMMVNNDPLPLVHDGDRVGVSITTSDATTLLPALQALGFQTTVSLPDRHLIEGFLPVSALADVTTLSPQGLLGVTGIIRPATAVGSVTSQADSTLQGARVRATTPPGVTGAGVKVGVISDSFNRLNGYAADIASGDLPNNIQVVLEGPTSNVIDEGRAMLQLVNDVAPGSPLAFASAFFGQAAFGQSIKDLANPAIFGAKVITDDIFYFEEPLFQDGLIAQGIDDVVTNRDVAYFALAGNLGDQSYESTSIAFPSAVVPALSGASLSYYDFNPGAGVDVTQRVTLGAGQSMILNLQWDQPFFTANGVTTDLDFFVIDPATNSVVAFSARDNIAQQVPSEILALTNTTGAPKAFDIVINKFTGPNPGRIKFVNYGANNSAPITFNEYATNSPTVIPHSSALGLSVGASPFFDQLNPEGFTSVGPNTILFNPNGTPKAAPEVRQTPDITATDGTDTTFFGSDVDGNGFRNFFGTSAAAPHAAAIAALLRQSAPGLTANQVYSRMIATATDIVSSGVGFDNKTGAGLVNGYKAVFGAPVASGANTIDGFESGVLGGNWDVFNSGAARTQVSTGNAPASGNRHLVFDSLLASGFTTPGLGEAILNVNLAGRTNVGLSYAYKSFGGEIITALPATFTGHTNADGVSFSVDGVNWFGIDALSSITNSYQTATFNLSAAAAAAGVTLGANTQIKFQRFGASSGQVPNTGLAFDNVRVTALSQLTNVQIDDGGVQRSRIRSFTVDLIGNVVFTSITPPAYKLQRSDGLTIPLAILTATTGNGSSRLVLQPVGPDVQGGSIPDGFYTLTIDGSLMTDDAGALIDAAGNGIAGSTRVLNFFRFFGDSNGDGAVDGTDYLAFRTAYVSGNATTAGASIFDFNGDGAFTIADLQAFNDNFRKRRLATPS